MAVQALLRVDDGAYANLVLPGLLAAAGLDGRDRAFATELVYGTTRMRRACDWLVDPFLDRPVDPEVRALLRLGAYQLAVLATPAHAAVSATVALAPPRARGLVNAVLRRAAAAGPPEWPDPATRLSYPDWIVARLTADLGEEAAVAALEQMNVGAAVSAREDGYVQDRASQWVAAHVGAGPGDRVADVCAGPGGKATAMASTSRLVVAVDVHEQRARSVADNAAALGRSEVAPVVADSRRPPLRPASFERVLVDAPCSGLGALRRRPDARWRMQPDDVGRLASLQRALLDAAVGLLAASGRLVYSVCTLTAAETTAIDRWLAARHPDLDPVPAPGPPWRPLGRGALLLPQAAGTDGMYVLGLRRP